MARVNAFTVRRPGRTLHIPTLWLWPYFILWDLWVMISVIVGSEGGGTHNLRIRDTGQCIHNLETCHDPVGAHCGIIQKVWPPFSLCNPIIFMGHWGEKGCFRLMKYTAGICEVPANARLWRVMMSVGSWYSSLMVRTPSMYLVTGQSFYWDDARSLPSNHCCCYNTNNQCFIKPSYKQMHDAE